VALVRRAFAPCCPCLPCSRYGGLERVPPRPALPAEGLQSLGVAEVVQWLQQAGLEQYAPAIEKQQVDGTMLEYIIAHDGLRDLGITSTLHQARLHRWLHPDHVGSPPRHMSSSCNVADASRTHDSSATSATEGVSTEGGSSAAAGNEKKPSERSPSKTTTRSSTAVAQPLPPGWQSAVDPASNKTYYANALTGETSWEHPGGSV